MNANLFLNQKEETDTSFGLFLATFLFSGIIMSIAGMKLSLTGLSCATLLIWYTCYISCILFFRVEDFFLGTTFLSLVIASAILSHFSAATDHLLVATLLLAIPVMAVNSLLIMFFQKTVFKNGSALAQS